jgi:hypothetical protein
MKNNEQAFLDELQGRLAENRRLAEKGLLPKQLSGVASYLAFHTFRTLLWVSLLMTIAMFWKLHPQLMEVSKVVFWYE